MLKEIFTQQSLKNYDPGKLRPAAFVLRKCK